MDMSGPSHHKLVVYLNGKFIPKEKAFISVMDRGFLFGDGVYEVFPVYNNNIIAVSYTHLRAHETDSYLVCRLLLEKTRDSCA